MGQKEKLLAKLTANPKTFTFAEAESLLGYLGYEKCNKGKTSGSRIMFTLREIIKYCFINRTHERNF